MSQEEYFSFVQSLALDLNRRQVKLPSFPDVVVRIRSALDDPDTTADPDADAQPERAEPGRRRINEPAVADVPLEMLPLSGRVVSCRNTTKRRFSARRPIGSAHR